MNLHQTDVTSWYTKFENQKKDIQAKDKNIQDLTKQVRDYVEKRYIVSVLALYQLDIHRLYFELTI